MTRASRMRTDSYPAPPEGWTCFHCGENFKNAHTARMHFGGDPSATPGCLLKVEPGEERGLLRRIRGLEFEVAGLQDELQRSGEGDSDKDRELGALRSQHAAALRREEETGYARGLAAARADCLCPFCHDPGFDSVGLRAHLEHGDCQIWNATPVPAARMFSGGTG